MIFVDRNKVAAPNVLTKIGGIGEAELAKARAFYAKEMAKLAKSKPTPTAIKPGKRGTKSRVKESANFDFGVYRHDEVKEQLKQLFHGKCAYCEFRYAAGMTGDVEHYRPKGGYMGADGKLRWPGYYWLALKWENLLPSCKICNEKTKQIDLVMGQKRTLGKLNWFPLADEGKRAKPEGDVSGEDPLLLNPCVVDPAGHLHFVERKVEQNGEIVVERALLEGKTPHGAKSVEILGLNRADLVLERRKQLADMEGVMADIQKLFDWLTETIDPQMQDSFLKEIAGKRAKLEAFQNADCEFAALARQEVSKFIQKLEVLSLKK